MSAACAVTAGCNDNSADNSAPFASIGGTAGSAGARPTATAGSSAGAPGGAGSGGAMSAAGAGGSGGSTPAPMPAGAGGSAGGAAGAGGMSGGAGGASGAAGASGAGGAQGTAGSAGMSGVPGEAECHAQIVAAGRTVGACEMCLCGMDKCQTEIAALQGDANGNALVQCTNMSGCTGQCCLCGAPCSPVGTNFAMGPCAAATETAAGVTPGAGLGNAATVSMNCVVTGPADNSCARAVRLGDCAAMKCMTECGITACM